MMVRINLLPGKKKGGGFEGGSQLIILALVLLVAELVFLYWLYDGKNGELEQKDLALKTAQAEVAELEREKRKLPDLQRRVNELKAAEDVLADLTIVRTGPHHVLGELKRILNRPETPAEKKKAKLEGWDPNWAAENVYLTTFNEVDPGFVIITGMAKSDGDVAQFLLRLNTSKQFFANVDLRFTKEANTNQQEIGMIVQKAFELTTNVNFFYQTEDGAALYKELQGEGEEEAPAEAPPTN